ncbi:MAG: hypothetical protein JJU36_05480 [Phycisphaeraceae bacterium]|nr:hypothetical protein [Phycisphaeraceae bacterium]
MDEHPGDRLIEKLMDIASTDLELRQLLRQFCSVLSDRLNALEAEAYEEADSAESASIPEADTELTDELLVSLRDGLGGHAVGPVGRKPTAGEGSGEPDLAALAGERLARAKAAEDGAAGAIGEPPSDEQLSALVSRCRLKAEASRWAARRHRLMVEGVDFYRDIEPLDSEIISRAKDLPECFLWMIHHSAPCPDDLTRFEDVALCFETTAAGVGLARRAIREAGRPNCPLSDALALLAEAQSALRFAVSALGYHRDDPDQVMVHHWLRHVCHRHHVYIEKYMKAHETADPEHISDVAERIESLDQLLSESIETGKLNERALRKVRYHITAMGKPSADSREHHWRTIVDQIDQMIARGVAASNPEIRDLLLPIIDQMPDIDPLPANFSLVLGQLDRYMATRNPPQTPVRTEEPTEAVRQVMSWLRDRRIVLIGGDRRDHAAKALCSAFGLAELDWVATREHQSIAPFEPPIARPDTALVILAIRWSSHSFSNIRTFCDRHDKPLVRLPAGYGPNQVAEQIVKQVGDRLARAADESAA